jgi:hypothetical protein
LGFGELKAREAIPFHGCSTLTQQRNEKASNGNVKKP